MSEPDKHCVVCGRTFAWRKKWERDWHHVRHCSKSCRQRGLKPIDHDLEQAILTLLHDRTGSICPSEVARLKFESWRDHMEDVRMAARRLAARGAVSIRQSGREVDPSTARGPIRVQRTARTPRA